LRVYILSRFHKNAGCGGVFFFAFVDFCTLVLSDM